MITIRKITRSLTAVMPGWPIVIYGVCLAIPLARLAALLFTAGCAWFSQRESAASKGGKSHRSFDDCFARPGAG
jgi:hypothetical protein